MKAASKYRAMRYGITRVRKGRNIRMGFSMCKPSKP
jgi:hypothetical protein